MVGVRAAITSRGHPVYVGLREDKPAEQVRRER
jgi:hypothetical protein